MKARGFPVGTMPRFAFKDPLMRLDDMEALGRKMKLAIGRPKIVPALLPPPEPECVPYPPLLDQGTTPECVAFPPVAVASGVPEATMRR